MIRGPNWIQISSAFRAHAWNRSPERDGLNVTMGCFLSKGKSSPCSPVGWTGNQSARESRSKRKFRECAELSRYDENAARLSANGNEDDHRWVQSRRSVGAGGPLLRGAGKRVLAALVRFRRDSRTPRPPRRQANDRVWNRPDGLGEAADARDGRT